MNLWTGLLARLDTATPDGRRLAAPERLRTRPLPLPLVDYQGQPVGAVTALSIRADQLIAEGTIRDGLLQPGKTMPAALDLDDLTHDPDDDLHFTDWRIVGVTTHPYLTPAFPDAHIRLKEPT